MNANKRMLMNVSGRTTTILLDGTPILFKDGGMSWKHVRTIDGKTVHEMIKYFDDKYLHLIVEDIIDQLDRGVGRDDLVITVPEVVTFIRMGGRELIAPATLF